MLHKEIVIATTFRSWDRITDETSGFSPHNFSRYGLKPCLSEPKASSVGECSGATALLLMTCFKTPRPRHSERSGAAGATESKGVRRKISHRTSFDSVRSLRRSTSCLPRRGPSDGQDDSVRYSAYHVILSSWRKKHALCANPDVVCRDSQTHLHKHPPFPLSRYFFSPIVSEGWVRFISEPLSHKVAVSRTFTTSTPRDAPLSHSGYSRLPPTDAPPARLQH